jgi:O-acetyl-ADP-ribose deacetylase (regulator of RNase III)
MKQEEWRNMMIYREIKGDLFDVGPEYYLVHCISADFKMGAGIAKTFADLGCKRELFKRLPNYDWNKNSHSLWTKIPMREFEFPEGVIHLVTKERYFYKPTYQTIYDALHDLKLQIINEGTPMKIAMPKIGCGLDKLEWDKVREIILKVFEKTDLEILVRSLD